MARRGTFQFDLSQPLKRGTLLKQGAFHKAFKHRYFVLYPGFLVYYDDAQKWKLDVTKGNTLGGRIGAIKLKNGTCNQARNAPKGCKFGLIVHAPDPVNKRPTYLINATSKDERDDWIAAIKKATPTKSPQPGRKEIPTVDKKASDKSKDNHIPVHPTRTERQETANAAAILAAENAAEENGVNNPEDSITSIDEQLDFPPTTIDVRRDTATVAALSVTNENNTSPEPQPQDFDDEQATSIDDLLGPQNNPKDDSDNEPAPSENGIESPEPNSIPNGTSDPSPSSSPTPEQTEVKPPTTNGVQTSAEASSNVETESDPMELNETVENTINSKGKLEVVTSVTIACASNGEEKNGSDCETATTQEKESSEENTENKNEDDKREEEMKSSSEVLLTNNKGADCITVNVRTGEDSDSTSDDESPEENPISPQSSEPPSPLTPSVAPVINVEAPEGEEGKQRTSSGSSAGSGGKLSPPASRRKSSTPFIEKTGFLYKMGGKHKNWRRRFFILRPGGFHYYKKDPSSKPLGEVKLKNMSIFFPGVGERKQSFQFTVHTESSWNKRSDWVLAAQSEREMKEWITAFKLAGQKMSSRSNSPAGSDSEQ